MAKNKARPAFDLSTKQKQHQDEHPLSSLDIVIFYTAIKTTQNKSGSVQLAKLRKQLAAVAGPTWETRLHEAAVPMAVKSPGALNA
jgi:hypothetical protein